MQSSQLAQRIAHLTLLTKRIMRSTRSGDYHSAFRGAGLEFDQLREYQQGDDVRFIDWNSSAKINRLMIKQFVQERDRSVVLALDISSSGMYSSTTHSRHQYAQELAGTLALLAHYNKDNVGLLLFTDHVVKWLPPRRGAAHLARLITLLEEAESIPAQKTDLGVALTFLINHCKRNAVIFFISDWIDEESRYTKVLQVAACKHDLISVRVSDRCEKALPDIGLLPIQDPETGQLVLLDTSNKHAIQGWLQGHDNAHRDICRKHNIDLLDVQTDAPFIPPLIRLIQKRTGQRV